MRQRKIRGKAFLLLLCAVTLFILFLFTISLRKVENVALIRIIGEINSDSSIFGGVSSVEIVRQLELAAGDPNIMAIVLEINSPGGSVVAIDEVIRKLSEINKPKVAWIREMGTSGAYWIATYCDKIIANDFSLTGSIGVTASYLEFSGFLERYNISYIRIVSGERKDIGSPFKKPTEEEINIFMEIVREIHRKFIQDVARNRGLNESYVAEIADGSIFLGKRALELRLVDKLGSEKEVKEMVKELSKVKEVRFKGFEERLDLWKLLFSLFPSSPLLRLMA
ncbi:MAG: signal peptide peptidase SppA [Candidatus Nanoarchaeia archaeon]|nr:signal peptide peptidase SppA [Candidatus Haiyanarchaeum thermophilum]MCW1302950.1 signal peptide peptidase SppA [Candidatus Haiyanarchaeum thermophilum]MCW1303628.1 signal peptide peptidase SppA [Candidatus Haiyanarchaeum thermophilum]MCW1306309.1 signal peptide peptidase SppA [Candidatus Haiyanarchaeum thermophilum]MCW1307181.1 signal peptide peptidase SppA [Candidatus Haiyanarchaeum thermophilum]